MMKKMASDHRMAYGIAELADLLGVSIGLVRKLIRTGKLQSRRIGRRVLVPAAAANQLLLEGNALSSLPDQR
jgi:excisionase family DNA binding protein